MYIPRGAYNDVEPTMRYVRACVHVLMYVHMCVHFRPSGSKTTMITTSSYSSTPVAKTEVCIS